MSSLSTYHPEQMDRISTAFFERADGQRAVASRTAVVDAIVRGRFQEVFKGYGRGLAAIAVGGYGRAELFPHSDVDLLLLFDRSRQAERHKEEISSLLGALWDSKLRVSHSVRDPRDCTSLAPGNTELHISLLDTRFLAGDRVFFDDFVQSTLPRFYWREQKALLRSLAESARKRHAGFDRTIYHLEPDVKEGPGGLRDFQLACWAGQLDNADRERVPASEEFLPRDPDRDLSDPKRLLFAVRCYLHHYHGRDKNLLSFEMQDSIANAAVGKLYPGDGDVADLMRAFFRSARTIHRVALQAIEESVAPSSSLLALFRRHTSRLGNRHFSVRYGRIYFKDSGILRMRPDLALGVFEFQARHGLPLSAEAERRIRAAEAGIREHFDSGSSHWPPLKRILSLPHSYRALEAMRETGVLYSLCPEFQLIDCLVIRDFYHRYTVDEHTLVTIRVLKRLPKAEQPIDARFARLMEEVGRLDLLCCALLFHDVGKGADGAGHDEASAVIAERSLKRIGMRDRHELDTVLYLIREHLSMSEVMTKRDLSEPSVLGEFKAKVGTLERLKLLTLMTYVDTVAVNPQAVTTWRKELLWRLYLGVHGVFERDHEDFRIRPESSEVLQLAAGSAERRAMQQFLAGFPVRYLRTHEPEEIYEHFQMASQLEPGDARAASNRVHGELQLVVLAWERPFLFASLCAAISSCEFNIEHAEAFSNQDGLVLDAFRVSGPRRAPKGEVDPRDVRRLERRMRRIADGSLDPADLVRSIKPPVDSWRDMEPPRVSFESETSARATIFYVHSRDRRALLYELAVVFSQNECDIDVVLCQTQGGRAIDAFYVRRDGAKLPDEAAVRISEALLQTCRHSLLA